MPTRNISIHIYCFCLQSKKRTKKNTAPEPLLQATLHPAGHPPKDSKFRVKCRGSRWSCPRMFTSTFYGQVSHGFTIFPIQITGSVQQYSIFCGLGIYVVGQASIPSSWQIRCRYHIWIYIYIHIYHISYLQYNPEKGFNLKGLVTSDTVLPVDTPTCELGRLDSRMGEVLIAILILLFYRWRISDFAKFMLKHKLLQYKAHC